MIVRIEINPGRFTDLPDDHPQAQAELRRRQEIQASRQRRAPCAKLGRLTSETLPCDECGDRDNEVALHHCGDARHPLCTIEKRVRGLPTCKSCPHWQERGSTGEGSKPRVRERRKARALLAPAGEPAVFPLRFDEKNLGPGFPGLRFNPSILADGDGYVFVYRNGWAGSDIWGLRLDSQFRPLHLPVHLNLYHKDQANYGREDPRLFRFRGRIHCMFTGVVGNKEVSHTSVLYARLGDDLSVEEVFYPHYPERTAWEKNWAMFEHGDTLYAVYSIASLHRILRIDGNRAEDAFVTKNSIRWKGGELRGGASPVRVGSEFWSFCHDRVEKGGQLVYRTCLYTFSAEPPFEVLRVVPEPILTADHGTNPGNYADVVWVGGAVLREVAS